MEDDEVVETSDYEEIEAIEAQDPNYWTSLPPPQETDIGRSGEEARTQGSLKPVAHILERHIADELLLGGVLHEPPRKRLKSCICISSIYSNSGTANEGQQFQLKLRTLFAKATALATRDQAQRLLSLGVAGSVPTHVETTLAQESAQTEGRYSLRARQARQKNPYAYDKALYKRQMRANPDAIVKMLRALTEAPAASDPLIEDNEIMHPRRRRRSTSTIPSVASMPSSPTSRHAISPLRETQHDSIPPSGSPEPPPPSSTPIDFGLLTPTFDHNLSQSPSESEVDISVELERSHRQGSSESSAESSVELMSAKDRRRLKALQKMMPRVLIERHLHNASAPRHGNATGGHGYDGDEGAQRVGWPSKFEEIRKALIQRYQNRISILLPPSQRWTWWFPAWGISHETFSRAEAEDEGGDDSIVDETDIGHWASERVIPSRHLAHDEVREGDLIDRMLSRTRVTGGKARRSRQHRRVRRTASPLAQEKGGLVAKPLCPSWRQALKSVPNRPSLVKGMPTTGKRDPQHKWSRRARARSSEIQPDYLSLLLAVVLLLGGHTTIQSR
ncbi:predicted protein [Postia placenta Mad-698-R]|nr:predicted protein [Postia placenta Mad-698-R]